VRFAVWPHFSFCSTSSSDSLKVLSARAGILGGLHAEDVKLRIWVNVLSRLLSWYGRDLVMARNWGRRFYISCVMGTLWRVRTAPQLRWVRKSKRQRGMAFFFPVLVIRDSIFFLFFIQIVKALNISKIYIPKHTKPFRGICIRATKSTLLIFLFYFGEWLRYQNMEIRIMLDH
jgi:hypothetical protein